MDLEIRYKLVQDNVKVFGKGPCTLLETIGRLGSLSKASSELNISYSKAWSIINRAEQALGYSLLLTHVGGSDGGGSNLTPDAIRLIRNYKLFCKEADDNARKIYKKYFKD